MRRLETIVSMGPHERYLPASFVAAREVFHVAVPGEPARPVAGGLAGGPHIVTNIRRGR